MYGDQSRLSQKQGTTEPVNKHTHTQQKGIKSLSLNGHALISSGKTTGECVMCPCLW